MSNHDSPRLLPIGELADRTGLPVAWLRREADAGRVPCMRVGRRRMFSLTAVQDALAARQAADTRRAKVSHGK